MAEHTMTEDERKCTWKYIRERGDTPRKNLLKLISHINQFDPFPDENSWEYIFFDRQLTDEMVDFALKMELRHKYQMQELADLEEMSLTDTRRLVDEMAHIGILEYCAEDAWGDTVVLPVFAPGSMENTAMDVKRTDTYTEMAPSYLNYIRDTQEGIADFVPSGAGLMRTIPVEDAIRDNEDKVPREEISHWLDEAGESLAVCSCECRRLSRMCNEGTADLEGDWCILLGNYAENCIHLGKARRITREEADGIIKQAEELGYVHQLTNIDGPDVSRVICNCSWDTCVALRASWYTQTPNLSSSNYKAKVENEKCTACGRCVDVCPQNAVKLGEKLCQKNPVKIQDQAIPNDHIFFGEKYRQPDFLKNRDHVVLQTGTSPCMVECPAHLSPQGFMKMAAEGKEREALELIKKENPFPAVCGRVCHRPCERVCIRGKEDAPVNIAEVEKQIAGQDLTAGQRYVPDKRFSAGKKIAVIGSGPAGLSCAYYLALYGHQVTVFEKEKKPGGMMTFGIPSFRLEREAVEAEIQTITDLGVQIVDGVEVGKDVTIQKLRERGYQGFYLAIGARESRKLDIPGEESEGVSSALDFLKKVETGEQEPLSGKVLVIGGGNTAVDAARTALRCGADSVNLFCLESRREMPAAPEALEQAMKELIPVHCGWGPAEILTENGKVIGIRFKKCTMVRDKGNHFRPQYDEGETMIVNCDYVVTAIGQSIDWGGLLNDTKVKLCRNQTVQADPWTQQTDEPDIFVGGDAGCGPGYVIDAIAAGKEGAESLHRYVWEGHSLTLGRVKQDNYHSIDENNLEIGAYDMAQRQQPGKDPDKERTMADDRLPFTEEQVKTEAARCLSCGAARVDRNICIGCGLCVTRCRFDAISLIRTGDDWGVPYEELVGHAAKDTVSRVGRSISRSFRDVQEGRGRRT